MPSMPHFSKAKTDTPTQKSEWKEIGLEMYHSVIHSAVLKFGLKVSVLQAKEYQETFETSTELECNK